MPRSGFPRHEQISEAPDALVDPDRDRGGLSRSDREFLLGEREYESEGTAKNTERRIAQRLRDSLLDFYLAVRLLEPDERRRVFRDGVSDDDQEGVNSDLVQGLASTFQFIYLGLRDVPVEDFEEMVERAVTDGELQYLWEEGRQSSFTVDVDLDIDIDERFDKEEARRKFEMGEAMTPDEIGGLLLTGEVESVEDVLSLAAHARDKGLIEKTFPSDVADVLSEFQEQDVDASTAILNPLSASELQLYLPPDEGTETAYQAIEKKYDGDGEINRQQRMAVKVAYDGLKTGNISTAEELINQVYRLYPQGYENANTWLHDFLLPELEALGVVSRNTDAQETEDDTSSDGE